MRNTQIPLEIILLLSPPEAARALKLSERTLSHFTANGTIPCIRIGRSVRYSPDALRAWIAAQMEVQPNE